jgi:hypothetical protein
MAEKRFDVAGPAAQPVAQLFECFEGLAADHADECHRECQAQLERAGLRIGVRRILLFACRMLVG